MVLVDSSGIWCSQGFRCACCGGCALGMTQRFGNAKRWRGLGRAWQGKEFKGNLKGQSTVLYCVATEIEW